MPILESKLERYVAKFAKDLGMLTFKVSPAGSRGWPDRVFINQSGQHLYIEFKQPGKKLRKLQQYRAEQMALMNCKVLTIDDREEGYGALLEFYQT